MARSSAVSTIAKTGVAAQGRSCGVIEYTLHDWATPVHDSYRLVTSILDPGHEPALELAAL